MNSGNVTEIYKPKLDLVSHILFAVQTVTVALILFGNLVTIVAIGKFRHLRTVANMFVVSLSVADLLMAVATPICCLVRFTTAITDTDLLRPACLSCIIVTVISQGMSIFNLILIAIDRYISIFYALRYKTIVTKKRVSFVLVIVWVFIVTNACTAMASTRWPLPYCSLNHMVKSQVFNVYVAGVLVFIIVLNTILYSRIFYEARKHAKYINDQMQSVDPENMIETRMSKTMIMVCGAFIISWAPYITLNIIRTKLHEPPYWFDAMHRYSIGLLNCNSFMNPIIYSCKNEDMFKAFKSLFVRGSRKDTDPTRQVNQS